MVTIHNSVTSFVNDLTERIKAFQGDKSQLLSALLDETDKWEDELDELLYDLDEDDDFEDDEDEEDDELTEEEEAYLAEEVEFDSSDLSKSPSAN